MLTSALNVLVTMGFNEAQIDRLRQVSLGVRVMREDPAAADYSRTDVLYAGAPPRDLRRAQPRREPAPVPGRRSALEHGRSRAKVLRA